MTVTVVSGLGQSRWDRGVMMTTDAARPSLIMSAAENRTKLYLGKLGQAFLFLVTSIALLAVGFIFYFMIRDAVPFFWDKGFMEFFFSANWYPSQEPPAFGCAAIFLGSILVTAAGGVIAVPVGITVAVCMSDILPFGVRQWVKPIIEMLASIPSVAFGFFALVVFAPFLQEAGGEFLAWSTWILGAPIVFLGGIMLGEIIADLVGISRESKTARFVAIILTMVPGACLLSAIAGSLATVEINSGTNALNVSIILAVMAMPTIISVAEDALQAAGSELRMASYALGATRAETLVRAIIPAASSGIIAAVILGLMRMVGETMVVWMASGNAAKIPTPWFDLTEPVRTLTASIAGDMGEADQSTGSARYHVLFAMAVSLLTISFLCNIASEWAVRRNRKRLRGE